MVGGEFFLKFYSYFKIHHIANDYSLLKNGHAGPRLDLCFHVNACQGTPLACVCDYAYECVRLRVRVYVCVQCVACTHTHN